MRDITIDEMVEIFKRESKDYLNSGEPVHVYSCMECIHQAIYGKKRLFFCKGKHRILGMAGNICGDCDYVEGYREPRIAPAKRPATTSKKTTGKKGLERKAE